MSKNKFKNLNTLKDFENQFISKDALELTKIPITKNTINSHYYIGTKNQVIQLDVLFFPETKSNFKYVLVACDVATNTSDAEPMKLKDATTVKEAFKIILKRKYIHRPSLIMTDGGGEFKGVFQHYLHSQNIGHQTTSRHRQLHPVDRICFLLGKYLNKVMLSEEIRTGKLNVDAWKQHLSKLIEILNKSYTKEVVDIDTLNPEPLGKGEVLHVDAKVRVALEKPIEYITNKALIGKFRTGDVRWSKEIYTIYQIMMNPSQPVTYMLKDDKDKVLDHIVFTAHELQVVT